METNKIYKCPDCGELLEVVVACKDCDDNCCKYMCCDKEMEELKANTVDAAQEKHVPVIEEGENGIKVKVGSVPHPMEEEHYIQMIEVMIDGKVYRQNLNPGDAPEAEFPVKGNVVAREFCNLHGLWATE
jgi:superoxide reductase